MSKPQNPLILVILCFCFTAPVTAQQQPETPVAPPKSICETNPNFNDFDFWLGEWNVYSNDDSRTFQGTNSITRHHKNCLIMENWQSAQGGTGSSMNYYDVVEDRWRQLWVDNGIGFSQSDQTRQ